MEVSDTTRMIEDLTTDVEKVKSLHSKILASAISDQQMKADLDDLMSVIKTSSQVIRAKLK
ncbi:Syntaxin-1A, partial [Orchesella cincta]